MEIYYVNHKDQKIDFMNGNYDIEKSSLFSHEWEYETQTLSRFGEKITQLSKKAQKKDLTVHVGNHGLVSCEKAYNQLLDITEADNFEIKPGKLYVDNSYLKCFVVTSEPKYFVPGIKTISCELGLIASYPFWITEQHVKISAISDNETSEETGVKTYPYTYSYKYPSLKTETNVYVDHYTESDFKLTVYGPTTSVLININGYPYEVMYPLEAGEYMVIDSRPFTPKEEKLYVVRANGTRENIFHYRSVEHSVFKKIPPGTIKIDYPRNYGVDLIIYKERSEPPWKS